LVAGSNTANYESKLYNPDAKKFDQTTNRIDLTSVAAPGPDTGPPGVPNNPLRPNSPQIFPTEIAGLQSPDLPALAAGGYYRLLTVTSVTDTDITFSAADSTGYGLFAASSPNLVENGDGGLVLDPSTTLNPVYLDGSQTVGAYSGSNQDLVLRANAGVNRCCCPHAATRPRPPRYRRWPMVSR
jgi:hypothetical protein